MSPRRKSRAAGKGTAGDGASVGALLLTELIARDPVLRTISRAAFVLVMVFALLLLWRGHNAPGGGFIAGLMTACALILHRIATGQTALRLLPLTLLPWGLALAFGTGLVPYLLGKAFLKSDYGYLTTALTGEFEWATALLFDLGVYLVVVGGSLHIASALIEVRPEELVPEDREPDAGSAQAQPAGGGR